jgi:hypothetical protein
VNSPAPQASIKIESFINYFRERIMQTSQTRVAPKVPSRTHQFLRLFIIATAATLLMSIWMAAHAQTTTIYSGTYYPVYPAPNYYPSPNYYYYVPPQPGYNYPVGPSNGAPTGPVIPPYVTTLPSNGYYAPYSYGPYYGNYPVWVPQSGVYYSGPAGGGGSIYSNSTITGSNNGISYGPQGWSFNLGNNTSHSSSTVTVTTHR